MAAIGFTPHAMLCSLRRSSQGKYRPTPGMANLPSPLGSSRNHSLREQYEAPLFTAQASAVDVAHVQARRRGSPSMEAPGMGASRGETLASACFTLRMLDAALGIGFRLSFSTEIERAASERYLVSLRSFQTHRKPLQAGWPPEHGYVYTMILMRIYEVGGPIDDDEQVLARRTGYAIKKVAEAIQWLVQRDKIQRLENGLLDDSRTTHEELAYREKLIKDAQNAGNVSGKKETKGFVQKRQTKSTNRTNDR